jgi:16S rRNA (adenine1518-N6/adenine1519-N6)-dimethyltransferase
MARIIFADAGDNVIGSGTKREAWTTGAWHRIVRVFLLNAVGEVLITRRSANLSSSPGKWNDSSSGHVDEGETYEAAALRELQEEIGVSGVVLNAVAKVKNSEEDEPDKIKNRFHMIYTGNYDGLLRLNPQEVSEARWISPANLRLWIGTAPAEFTEGFKLAFDVFYSQAAESEPNKSVHLDRKLICRF